MTEPIIGYGTDLRVELDGKPLEGAIDATFVTGIDWGRGESVTLAGTFEPPPIVTLEARVNLRWPQKLPRKVKKAWRKVREGRPLTAKDRVRMWRVRWPFTFVEEDA